MPAVAPDRIGLKVATPLRRVLIVAPHFPPTNAPDLQRVRMALPWLTENGWKAEVLAVAPDFVEAPLDPGLEQAMPSGTIVHRVYALPQRWTRRFGWGSLARRAYPFLKRRGDSLLASRRFDLVLFSTSQFGVLPLGPRWKKRHGVPFILDFHDEWVSDYYRRHSEVRPPGGRFKYAVSHALARWQEGEVVRHAAQILSVSARYNFNLLARHPGLDAEKLHELPFGGAESDFELLKTTRFSQSFFRPNSGTNWVYVGRGGPAMRLAASAFFLALRRAVATGIVDPTHLRLHFIGTDYATGSRAQPTFVPVAREFGVESMVREQTARIPHFTVLQCLRDADALIVPGSNDPGYTASKIFPCILARRPMLAIFHRDSSCGRIVAETHAGTLVTFGSIDESAAIAACIYDRWFAARAFNQAPSAATALFEPHSARTMTRRLAAIFDVACPRKGSCP
jgi:glycosyltransferase involved in cell wall biosynthesis